jgi:hypothetical protein
MTVGNVRAPEQFGMCVDQKELGWISLCSEDAKRPRTE